MPGFRNSTDVISDGSTERRRRRWPVVVLAIVVVVALAASWGDHLRQRAEFHSLLSKTADVQATASAARLAVLSTRQYTMPLLVSSSSATVRSGLAKLVDDSAARGAADLRAARRTVAATTILPWHHGLRDAKRADLAYLDQRIADFDHVAHGADLALLASPAAGAAATAASAALQSVAPTSKDTDRVASVFKP